MVRRKLILMGLLTLALTGCINQSTDNSAQPPDKTGVPGNSFEAFVQEIQSENLNEYETDIVSKLEEYLDAPEVAPYLVKTDITNIDYTLEKYNFSKNDEPSLNDMIVKISIEKEGSSNAASFHMDVIFAFILNVNGRFDLVLEEKAIGIASSITYEVMDITGDNKDEIILNKNIGRQVGARGLINIYTWCPEQNNMLLIFNEERFGHGFSNSYQFIPMPSGKYDIILDSKIYYAEDDILESGSTRFVFDGNAYVVSGTYYEYRTRAQLLYL